MSHASPPSIWTDSRWYLHALFPAPEEGLGVARFVHLEPGDFRDRYWTLRHDEPPEGRTILDLDLTGLAGEKPPEAAASPRYYIFHSAFCGSTLLARALSADPRFFTLFEPRVLQDLRRRPQRAPADQRLALKAVAALLGRTPAPGQFAAIKVHSACNSLMPLLVSAMAEPRGLFLHQDLESFLAQVLKSQDRRAQIRASQAGGELPLRRFIVRPPKPVSELTMAEAAATTWLHSIQHFLDLVGYHGHSSIRSLDSADLFAHPLDTFRAIVRHATGSGQAGDELPDETIAEAFRHHSKDPTRSFGERERLAEKAAVALEFRAEIEEGMAWARILTAGSPLPDHLPLPLLDAPDRRSNPLLPEPT